MKLDVKGMVRRIAPFQGIAVPSGMMADQETKIIAHLIRESDAQDHHVAWERRFKR